MAKYYYWLIPDEPHRSRLQRIINNFANIYRGPCFAPHLTLATGQHIPPSPSNHRPIALNCQRVESQADYFRALYYRCKESPSLLSLSTFFTKDQTYTPHISLLYGDHSDARKRVWCANTSLYPHPIMCSRIWIVKGATNVHNWRVVKEYSLS